MRRNATHGPCQLAKPARARLHWIQESLMNAQLQSFGFYGYFYFSRRLAGEMG